eukprot:1161576-Pelagomonas_calceolata.AAC.2
MEDTKLLRIHVENTQLCVFCTVCIHAVGSQASIILHPPRLFPSFCSCKVIITCMLSRIKFLAEADSLTTQ